MTKRKISLYKMLKSKKKMTEGEWLFEVGPLLIDKAVFWVIAMNITLMFFIFFSKGLAPQYQLMPPWLWMTCLIIFPTSMAVTTVMTVYSLVRHSVFSILHKKGKI